MKNMIIALAALLFSAGSLFAQPRLKSLSNKYGKTVIKVEIPVEERDAGNGISVDCIRLYNCGEEIKAKKVDAVWSDNAVLILKFKKITEFSGCMLTFRLNGRDVSIDIQRALMER